MASSTLNTTRRDSEHNQSLNSDIRGGCRARKSSRSASSGTNTNKSGKKKRRRESTEETVPLQPDVRDEINILDQDDQSDERQESSLHSKATSKIYMTCIMQGHRLGVAYFNISSREMFVTETYEEEDDFSSLQMIKYQVQPEIIFTSTKADEIFLAALRQKVSAQFDSQTVKLAKSALFSHQQAWHRLAYLQIKGMKSDFKYEERIRMLSSLISMESEMQVRAAGALLAILQQEMLIGTTERPETALNGSPNQSVQIDQISEFSLDGLLHMDAATYDALQIFHLESHASAMGIGKAKEGFSVFGMLNKCVTQTGRRLLRSWFMRPILDLVVLNDRLNSIQAFQAAPDIIEALQGCLRNIKDVTRILKKIFSPNLGSTSDDWLNIVESISALWQMRGILELTVSQQHHQQNVFVNLLIIAKISSSINEELVYISDLINGVIDFDQVCGENLETLVAYGFCDELDELKRLYEGLPDFLNQVTTSEQRRLQLPPKLQSSEVSAVYIPQVGFFIRFTGTAFERATLENLPDLDFAFQGRLEENNQIPEMFFRTSRTRQLDANIGDIYHKILDMERAILRNLEEKIGDYAESLNSASMAAAELDCILGLSIAAREYKYERPILTDQNILFIKNGRHVLQEMTVENFVPNDTEIEGQARICVITGPNYSGKSIYAKQVALVVFLAHIGCFVPAEKATIGLTDRIFTRITSKETMALAECTFMIDMKQIATMVRHSTFRSLCIIDEFGKGTLTEDGVGLLCATLHHFASRELPPKVLAITHFTELSDENLLPKSPKLAFHTMSILEAEKDQTVNMLEDVVFLYRLIPGYATPSYGLPNSVIDRSKEILQHILAGEPISRYTTTSRLAKDKICQEFFRKLSAFDCSEGDVETFVRDLHTIAGNGTSL